MVPSAKMFEFSGQKPGPENTKYGTQKWDQKSVPGCFLVIIIIRGGIFRGTVSGPPKCVPRHVFQAPFLGAENSSGTRGNFRRKAKQKRIHQSIHPENPSLPHLDIAVAGHAPHMAASSGKMPIKAHLLLLVLQKTACASVLKLRQAHNKPDS